MLKLDELTTDDGNVAATSIDVVDGVLHLVGHGEPVAIPTELLEAIMSRYGAPFDPSERIIEVGSLELGSAGHLRAIRHLARFDVIARDYLVYEVPGNEPCCALAKTVAAALRFIRSTS